MSFIRISECGKASPLYEHLKKRGILDECPRCEDLGEEGGCPECGLVQTSSKKTDNREVSSSE